MRKKKKIQLLEIIDSLIDASQTAKELFTSGRDKEAVGLLAECQDAAIEVGNTIEQSMGGGTKAVFLLEQLCELFYYCSMENIVGEQAKKCNKAEKKLRQIQTELSNNVPTEKLAVFLPYKLSMWDSLESIWKAADEDEEWISVVVPIPYFIKKQDGTVDRMVYEGKDYPENVPVTDWQSFSLEEEHPDIIFIHNPYDQYNYVTTIHPDFYASQIINYTDQLVYVPYFLHQNDTVDKKYCTLVGILYSDIVVLQSEKVRQQYIEYYKEAVPELVKMHGNNAVERKFRALGSPKLDSERDKQATVPEEWMRMKGEANKKVIFFNTHISGLMQFKSDKFLQKLQWLIGFFEKRKDVLLLWRPHPLSVETAQAMNPEAVAAYQELVESYKRKKIGIFDDSKDLHRAVDFSDAYYGGGSSVAEIFRQQNKPVMIMDYEVPGE